MSIPTPTNMILQLELNRLGTYSGEIDGVFGTKTKLAFNRMQNLGLQKESKNFDWSHMGDQNFIKNPNWMTVAYQQLIDNICEIPGFLAEERILEYHRSVQLKTSSDEVPWCSSFVNWCLQKVGIKGSCNAAARSWLNWGRFLENPCFGSVVVLSRGSGNVQGHVGFYVGKKNERLFLLGGNQNNRVQVSNFNQTRFLAAVWPFDLPINS